MARRKLLFICIVFMYVSICAPVRAGVVCAASGEEGPSEGSDNDIYNMDAEIDEIMDRLDIESVDRELDRLHIEGDISLKNLTESIMQGDFSGVLAYMKNVFLASVTDEIVVNKDLMLRLVAVILAGAMLVSLSASFGGGTTAENGFYITYLIITSIILSSFMLALDITSGAISEIISVIKVLIPVYILSLGFLGEAASATWMYQIMLLGIWLTELFILRIIIPMIRLYVILSLVNNISKEDSFSKLTGLLKSLISWILKTMIIFIAGINIIKTMLAPAMDSVKRSAVNRVINALPGGSALSLLTGTFLSAGRLVKNSIGVAGIMIIVIIVLIPVIKLIVMMLMTRLTAALVQPVGDKRFAEGIDCLSEGIRLSVTALGSAVVIFMLSIALIAATAGVG